MEIPHEYSKHHAKTRIGNLLCLIGLHWWKYHCYRTCKRCGRTQTLYDYWED